jgi:hypothetical protein
MIDEPSAEPTPLACPYCRGPLTWAPHRWQAAFECPQCGQFSDFVGSSLRPAEITRPLRRAWKARVRPGGAKFVSRPAIHHADGADARDRQRCRPVWCGGTVITSDTNVGRMLSGIVG